MAVVWGTVKDHNGYIDVRSMLQKGTTVNVYFPATPDQPDASGTIDAIWSFAGKGEHILVVDDEEEQREITVSLLDELGYKTASAASGEEAVAYVAKHAVDLIILDMIMDPGIDGLETYRRILKHNPGQKALIASGYSESQRVRETLSIGAGAYIKKPYRLESIAEVIRKELDRPI
jgi:CheY-like chemotaxis protein